MHWCSMTTRNSIVNANIEEAFSMKSRLYLHQLCEVVSNLLGSTLFFSWNSHLHFQVSDPPFCPKKRCTYLYSRVCPFDLWEVDRPHHIGQLKQGTAWVLSIIGGEPPASDSKPDDFAGKHPKVELSFFYILFYFLYSHVRFLS